MDASTDEVLAANGRFSEALTVRNNMKSVPNDFQGSKINDTPIGRPTYVECEHQFESIILGKAVAKRCPKCGSLEAP